jgi:hypothetical protein
MGQPLCALNQVETFHEPGHGETLDENGKCDDDEGGQNY